MGTGFRHQKNFVAAAFEARAHPDFGFAAAIFPAVVEEGDSAIDGLMNDFDRGFFVRRFAEMVAAKAESGNFGVGRGRIFGGGWFRWRFVAWILPEVMGSS